jgi:hypothetical protein
MSGPSVRRPDIGGILDHCAVVSRERTTGEECTYHLTLRLHINDAISITVFEGEEWAAYLRHEWQASSDFCIVSCVCPGRDHIDGYTLLSTY